MKAFMKGFLEMFSIFAMIGAAGALLFGFLAVVFHYTNNPIAPIILLIIVGCILAGIDRYQDSKKEVNDADRII